MVYDWPGDTHLQRLPLITFLYLVEHILLPKIIDGKYEPADFNLEFFARFPVGNSRTYYFYYFVFG